MAKIDKEYNKILSTILEDGRWYNDPNRERVKRLQIPKYNFEYDLRDGFPILTTKKINFKNIVGELLWFLSGSTNIKYLVDNGINIWNKDAYNYYLKKFNGKYPKSPQNAHDLEGFISLIGNENSPQQWMTPYKFGDLGRVYGSQWRKWCGNKEVQGSSTAYTDQISNLIKNLKEKPLATDHIVTAWNPAELDNMALPPCHFGFQLMVYPLLETYTGYIIDFGKEGFTEKDKVWESPKYGFDLVWSQRSCDSFLGIPYNIASYALLAYIIGEMVNMVPGKIYGDLRNVHLYDNSIEAAKKQLKRKTDKHWKSTKLLMKDEFHYMTDIDLVGELSTDEIIKRLRINMFKLENYESYPGINVEMLSRDE